MKHLLNICNDPQYGLQVCLIEDLLQTKSGNTEGDSGGELGEEDIEGIKDSFVASGSRVLHLEIVNDVRQHRPVKHKVPRIMFGCM